MQVSNELFHDPTLGSWNYNFMGVRHDPTMKYELHMANPKEWSANEVHRPTHFLKFATIEEGESVGADRDDCFT